jgi:hypothetical protein
VEGVYYFQTKLKAYKISSEIPMKTSQDILKGTESEQKTHEI